MTGKYTNPNLRNAAVITIDTQNDFSLPGAPAEIQGTFDVLPNIAKILQTARKNQIPIIHVIRIYKSDGSNVDICRKELIESGTEIVRPDSVGANLVDMIKPPDYQELDYVELLNGNIQTIGNREWVMYKPRWGAFYQTKLDSFLKELGIDTLIFIGCNFPNCPRTSIYEASERDYRIIMIEDAVSGVYDRGLAEIMNIGVKVCKTIDFINELDSTLGGGSDSM